MFIVDTNVLMRYLLKDDDRQFLIAQSYFLNEQQSLFYQFRRCMKRFG